MTFSKILLKFLLIDKWCFRSINIRYFDEKTNISIIGCVTTSLLWPWQIAPTPHITLLLDMWHPSISLRTSTNRSEHPIRPLSINGRLPCVPLRVHDAFQAGSLTSSHEQSFFPLPEVRSTGCLLVLSGDLLHSIPCRLQTEMTG